MRMCTARGCFEVVGAKFRRDSPWICISLCCDSKNSTRQPFAASFLRVTSCGSRSRQNDACRPAPGRPVPQRGVVRRAPRGGGHLDPADHHGTAGAAGGADEPAGARTTSFWSISSVVNSTTSCGTQQHQPCTRMPGACAESCQLASRLPRLCRALSKRTRLPLNSN